MDSLGRVCGEDIYAPFDVPSFDRSAVNEYALIAEDTFSASLSNPIEIKIVGTLMPGDEVGSLRIDQGEVAEVATGAPLPLNANAVIMVEDAKMIN